MHERHARTVSEQIERGFGRRVLAPDDDDVLAEEGVRFRVVVGHVRQVLARDPEAIRDVIRAGGDDDACAARRMRASIAWGVRLDGEEGRAAVALRPDGGNRFVERDLEPERIGDAAVVAQRLLARRLVVRADERHPANLQQLRRREEDHVRRVVQERVDERGLLDHEVVEPRLLRRDGGREAGRASPTMRTSCGLHFAP